MTARRVLGADGCRAGWVVVELVDGVVGDVEVVGELAEAVTVDGQAAVGVDIPIGLVDGPRDADRAARGLLPGRASSVFSAPPRTVVDAVRDGVVTDHAAASALAVEVSGLGLSMQTWRILPKIVEVDVLVGGGHDLTEVHPEVAFTILAGGPVPRKKSWAGSSVRRAVLERFGLRLPDRFVGDEDCAVDDVLDAAVCALVADAVAGGGEVLTIDDRTEQRDHERPVVIVARLPDHGLPGPRRGSR